MSDQTSEVSVTSSPPTTEPHQYFHFVDGLRAIAVLAVIVFHLRPTRLPGGYLGVDVFFVISGFVVSASVASLHAQGVGFAAKFYARRARRILPALLVVIAVTVALNVMFVPISFLDTQVPVVALKALLGQANRALVATDGDYFSPIADLNPFAHLWSLGVEEQFYLLSPLVFAAWVARGRWRAVAASTVVVLASLSIVNAARLTASGEHVLAFYSVTTRFWQIAAGVSLHQLVGRHDREVSDPLVSEKWRKILLAGGSLAMIATFVSPLPRLLPGSLPPVAATLALIAGLLWSPATSGVKRVLTATPMRTLGKASYSLYLFHWPVFVLLRWTTGLESKPVALLALALTAALGAASYFVVESPFRRKPRGQPAAAWVVLTAAAMATGTVYAACNAMIDNRFDLSKSTVMRNPADWIPGFDLAPPTSDGCTLGSATRVAGFRTINEIERVGCVNPTDPKTLYIVGDSHSIQYLSAAKQYALTTGNRAEIVTFSGCAFGLAAGTTFDNPWCGREVNETLSDLSEAAGPGDVVFMSSLRLPRLSEQWQSSRTIESAKAIYRSTARARQIDERRWSAALAPIAEHGVAVLFPKPTPLFFVPPFRCLDWFNRANPICAPGFEIDRATFEDYRLPVVESMERVVSGLPGAALWDPLDSLCSETTCTAVEGKRPLFYDGDHLSAFGNRRVFPSLLETVSRLQSPPQEPSTAIPAG